MRRSEHFYYELFIGRYSVKWYSSKNKFYRDTCSLRHSEFKTFDGPVSAMEIR